jgi:uncharacterized protein YPO0396
MECDNRLRDLPANSPVVHIMRNHVEAERKARLKKLERDYQTNKDEQDEGHSRELRAHTESFIKRVDAVMAQATPQVVVRTSPFQLLPSMPGILRLEAELTAEPAGDSSSV